MNRRVRLSELLGHAEVDEGRSLRTERRRSNSEMDGRRCGRREQRKLIRARRGGLDAELCREPVQRCADEARCRSAARAAPGYTDKRPRTGAGKAVAGARVERSHRQRVSPLAGAGAVTYGAKRNAGHQACRKVTTEDETCPVR